MLTLQSLGLGITGDHCALPDQEKPLGYQSLICGGDSLDLLVDNSLTELEGDSDELGETA